MNRSPRSIIKRLKEAGFERVRIRGSHHYYHKEGFPLICVPVHGDRDIPTGTFDNILKAAGFK